MGLEDTARRRHLTQTAKESARLERGFGLAAGHEGHALVQRHLDRLVAFIRQARAHGRPTRETYFARSLTPEVFDLVMRLDDRDIAQAAFVGALNSTRRQIRDNERGIARGDKEVVGAELQRAARRHYLEENFPSLLRQIERATSYKRRLAARLTLERKLLKKRRIKFKWSKTATILVGNWALDCCLQALPDVFVERKTESGDTIVVVTESAWGAATRAAYQQVLRQQPNTPTTAPPEPWIWFTREDGYAFLRNCRDEKAAKDAILSSKLRRHMDAVNFLQSVAFTIDDYMLDNVQPLAHWDTVPLIGISRRRDRDLLRWDLEQAEQLRGQKFYVPLCAEWRGRLVPLTHFSYARADHIRALFRFAEGSPITERGIFWLKVAVANAFGNEVTRRSFEARAAWTDEHMPELRRLVDSPRANLGWREAPDNTLEPALWRQAGDPFMFLSAARELVLCGGNPLFISTLPIQLDASCSGAQHYSLILRDPAGARLTNLTPHDGPHDLYGEVARLVRERLENIIKTDPDPDRPQSKPRPHQRAPQSEPRPHRRALWWNSRKIDRNLIKPFVMTFLYGSGEPKQQVKLFEVLHEDDRERVFVGQEERDGFWEPKWRKPTREEDIPEGHIKWLVAIIREAIITALPGAGDVMKYIRDTAKMLVERRALSLRARSLEWVSPSGVPVRNEYRKPDEHVRWTYLGARPHQHKIADGYLPELQPNECRRSAAPNVVHSLDASHLAFVALACEAQRIPLITVHDAFSVLACHVDALREIWLRELRLMYESENVLQQIHDYARKHLGPNVPSIPPHRGLNLMNVTGPYALSS